MWVGAEIMRIITRLHAVGDLVFVNPHRFCSNYGYSSVLDGDACKDCPGGGIGRRASFRCWSTLVGGGSSPLLGTTLYA